MAATEATAEPTGRRPGRAALLLAASVLALALHLYGLYRPGGPPTPPGIPYADKLLHLLGFALPVAAILLWRQAVAAHREDRGLSWPKARRQAQGTVAVLVLFAGHAGVSELVQAAFYTQRQGDPYDALADLVGVAVGWSAYRLLRRRVAVR
jgi:hypothetical protein